ncbi:MAG: CBS domain-containing protein [Crenarchaeota archaeon]|nr:CBS domain-containing protein [Thermoproteota archaeon]
MQYKLTLSQREVLEALIKLYEQKKRLVKSKEIASLINRDEGTVRNIILSLKSLGLVESKTGPSGGYMPTLKAYEVVKGTMTQIPVKIRKDGKELDITIMSIELLDVLNPEGGRAILRVHGDVRRALRPGDRIEIGPTPLVGVRIEGEVMHVDTVSNQLSIRITRMVSIPRAAVSEIATPQPYTVRPDQPLREVARELVARQIRGAPVVEGGKIVGVITLTDIGKAFTEGRFDAKVREYMSTPAITVRDSDDILKAIDLMNRHGIGRLPVVDAAGHLVGIVTKTDIMRFIAGLR